jgi:rhamnulokinase
MSNTKQFLAVDLGAESGRVMRGSLAGGLLKIAEAHRFANGPLQEGESLRWDFAKLLAGVKRGIALGAEEARSAGSTPEEKEIAGISVDSWGVDFGLLDDRGVLVGNPYHYRDRQTEGMLEKAFERVPRRELYERTGIQFMRLNSLYQLLAMRLRQDPALVRARRLVFMADLAAHALCGEVFAEYTLASTSQMMDMRTGQWAKELLGKLDLPADLLPKVVKPGTVVGRLSAEVAE